MVDRIVTRRLRVLLTIAAVAIVLTASSAPVASSGAPLPASMAATGDSITRAFNDGPTILTDFTAGSWATGTDARVSSLYARLLSQGAEIAGKHANDARSGAKVADLAGQLATVAARDVDAVTILIGGNDVCASSESAMTSVSAFRTSFRAAFDDFTTGSPDTIVYVASIPSVEVLWRLFKGNASARSVWSLFRICQSMLANPTSTRQADVDRRARVIQRERDFNTAMRDICAGYVRCRWDGAAIFGTSFTTGDISTRDYFHPSIVGQRRLAAVTWSAWGFGGP